MTAPDWTPHGGGCERRGHHEDRYQRCRVAGVALAHWLHRTGHTPTLIEQAPEFRTGGYMIDFWGVGYRVAKRMGIEDQVRAAGYQMRMAALGRPPRARSKPTWVWKSSAA